eukprot:scaffold2312_cov165-Ochromonas_danica.AAC.58
MALSSSKSRRELFEEQLQDLQRDISNLSSKLAVPSIVTSTRFHNSSSHNNSVLESSSSQSYDPAVVKMRDTNTSQMSMMMTSSDMDMKKELELTREELRRALRDKDEALRKVDQLKKEVEELQKVASEIGKMKIAVDTLNADNAALKLSLESSERLRVQQKDLITMLHKSHALIGEGSVASFNSISSISHRDESQAPSLPPSLTPGPVPQATALENRDWLNLNITTSSHGTNKVKPRMTRMKSRSAAVDATPSTRQSPATTTPSHRHQHSHSHSHNREGHQSNHHHHHHHQHQRLSQRQESVRTTANKANNSSVNGSRTPSPSLRERQPQPSFENSISVNPSLVPAYSLSFASSSHGVNGQSNGNGHYYAPPSTTTPPAGPVRSLLPPHMMLGRPPLYPQNLSGIGGISLPPQQENALPMPPQPPHSDSSERKKSRGKTKRSSPATKTRSRPSSAPPRSTPPQATRPTTPTTTTRSRVLFRPLPSPASTFSKAPRQSSVPFR